MTRAGAAGDLRWWALRAHWALGIFLLAFFTEAPRWPFPAVAAAWAAGAALDRAGAPRRALSRLGSPIVAVFLAGAAADLLFGGRDLLASVSLLLLGIQSVKLLLPKRARDGWQLCAIAFLEFLAAAAVTERLVFALFAFLFLSASAGAMWALHGQEAEENEWPAGGYRPPPRLAAWVLLLTGVGGFLAAGILFAFVPRLEFRRGLQRLSRAQAVSGFADSITLREVTGIKADRSVVARVEFPSFGRDPSSANLYLRGALYSRYSNGGWQRRRSPVSAVPRAGFLHIAGTGSEGPLSIADITLEPADHPRLPTYGHPVRIEGPFGSLLADTEGNLFLPQPGHPTMRYRLWFEGDPPRRSGPDGAKQKEYIEFPAGYEDVRALGAAVMGKTGTDSARADRLLRFFRSGFRYTLADPAPSLRRFLFEEKAGYCEHYAAALALLLRAGGIPSRVAAGYLGGEWNALGQYLIVRQSDAHAWVEAWIDGRWVTMDATPPQGESSPFFRRTGPVGLYVDWLRQRWDKYVVNYSLRMQAGAVAAGWAGVRRTGAAFGFGRGAAGPAAARRAAGGALLAGGAFYWMYRRVRGKSGRAAGRKDPRMPAPYRRLLRRLERSGFRPSPGVPMEEMVAAAVRSRPELAGDAARFLALYLRDRFGPSPLPPDMRAEAFHRADRLRITLP